MFQVLVKTTATMVSAYTYLLDSKQDALEFVKRPDIWWYTFPSEHDDWAWHRGGAWKPAHEVTQEELHAPPAPAPEHPNRVAADEEEDGDASRW